VSAFYKRAVGDGGPVRRCGRAERGDLLVAAADEVPPHHDLFGERRAAEQEDSGRAVAGVDQLELPGTWGEIGKFALARLGSADGDRPGVLQDAVLERRIGIEDEAGAGLEGSVRRRVTG
jgi:hypothetical protein